MKEPLRSTIPGLFGDTELPIQFERTKMDGCGAGCVGLYPRLSYVQSLYHRLDPCPVGVSVHCRQTCCMLVSSVVRSWLKTTWRHLSVYLTGVMYLLLLLPIGFLTFVVDLLWNYFSHHIFQNHHHLNPHLMLYH